MNAQVLEDLKAAREAFGYVWPKGPDCEHTRAREGFIRLDAAIAALAAADQPPAARQDQPGGADRGP